MGEYVKGDSTIKSFKDMQEKHPLSARNTRKKTKQKAGLSLWEFPGADFADLEQKVAVYECLKKEQKVVL